MTGFHADSQCIRTGFLERKNGAKLESHGACDYSSTMVGDGDARFPSTMRLKKKAEFLRVFREGHSWRGSCFSLHVLTCDDADERNVRPRLGIVVTRKDGNAVDRNRLKRKVREAFRKTASRLPTADFVIRPKAVCLNMTEDEMVTQLHVAITELLVHAKEKT